ncbi:MAG: hypothetical protein GXO15_05425 [Crenarchaeota archaeon]|nr:hypothetical protein [Thermoproteota archaeon]
MACGLCEIVAALVLSHELGVAEEPGYEVAIVERHRRRRAEWSLEAVEAGLEEDVERFVTTSRPAAEGAYLDAVAAWRLYRSRCLERGGGGFCERLRRLAAARLHRALVLWAGSWGIGYSSAFQILRDLSRLVMGEIELPEYLRRHRGHMHAALAALHIAEPGEQPPFPGEVCAFTCKLLTGRRCSCSRLNHRDMARLYEEYREKIVKPLAERCPVLRELAEATGKSVAKLVDQAIWLAATMEERLGRDEAFAETFRVAAEEAGCTGVEADQALRRLEEQLSAMLRGE